MSTVAERPQYIGGPLCGDPVDRPAEPRVTITNPKVAKAHHVPGSYVYTRSHPTNDFVFAEEL